MRFSLFGEVEFVLRGLDGRPLHSYSGRNLITSAGFELVASLLGGTGDAISHIAIGSDSTTPALTDTDLAGTEHERIAATVVTNGPVVTLTGQFGAGIVSDVTAGEFGVFNAASGGDLFSRFVCPEFTFDSNSTLDFLWKIYIGAEES